MSADSSRSGSRDPDSGAPPITDARRQVTILFVDIADSTAMFSRLDPEDVAELIHALLHACAALVEKHGGTVDKFLGDGMMAKFGAPLAVEDAATRALRAALDIREHAAVSVADEQRRVGWRIPLRLHIGLDTGLVAMSRIVTDDTAMGERVVGAARVMAKSAGDEILVGENTMLASRDEFLFEQAAAVDLAKKSGGRHGSLRCFRLVAAKTAASDADPLGTHRPAAESIVGRSRERRLVEQFADTAGGDGRRLLLVTGDAGQGKTRLLQHLRSRIRNGVELEIESCREEERYAQHAPLVRLLDRWRERSPSSLETLPEGHRGVVEQLAGRTGEDAGQLQEGRIRAALAELFRRRSRDASLLVVLDDAHWCDEATLAVLVGAFGELEDGERVSLAIASRPEGCDRVLALAGRWSIAGPRLDHADLTGLEMGEATDLIQRMARVALTPGAARRLAEIAGGNPFCIEEIVLGLNARRESFAGRGALTTDDIAAIHIPVRVEDIVMTRVAGLDAAAREVLEAASVIGESFLLGLLEGVVADAPKVRAALKRLEDDSFLHVEGDGPDTTGRFPHSYRRAAVYQSIPNRRRSALHLATATILRSEAGNDLRPIAALLAHHYAAAGADAEAEEALLVAGTWAVRSAAGTEGLRHLARAKELYLRRVGDQADRSHLRLLEKNLGLARLLSGDLVGSVENFDAALRLLGMVVPDGPRRRMLFAARDALGAITHIRFGVRRRPWLPPELQRELFEILYNRCRAQNPTDAERSVFDNFAAIRQLTYLDRTNVPGAASLYASAGAFFAFAGLDFTDLPRFAITRARAILDENDPGERFEVDSMAFVVRYLRGDWDDAGLVTEEALDTALELGLSWNLDVYQGFACERHIKQGNFDEARRLIEWLQLLRDRGGYAFASSNIEANTAYLHLELAEWEAGHAAACRFAATRDEPTLRLIALSTQARASMGLGDREGASEAIAQAARVVASSHRPPPYYLSAYWVALLEAATLQAPLKVDGAGMPAEARLRKEALRCAANVARDRAAVHRLLAILAQRRGDAKESRLQSSAAWNAAVRLGMRPEQARLGRLFESELEGVAPAGWRSSAADEERVTT